MSAVPCGWNAARLGDVCDIVSGGTPKTSESHYWGDAVAWITPADLSRDRSQTVFAGARGLSTAGYRACSARIIPRGSVIVSSRAPIGYVAIAGTDVATNQGCKSAVPPDFIDSRYLYWYLLNAKSDLEDRASGTTFKEISGREFANTVLKWPGLDEQRRIVDILEDHLSRLEFGVVELGRSSAHLELYTRRRRLALVLGSSAGSLNSIDPSALGGGSAPTLPLPPGWAWKQWRGIGRSQNGSAFPSRDYTDDGVRLLRPGNLGRHGRLRWDDKSTRWLPLTYEASHAGLVLRPGDIVMNLTAQSLKDDFLGRACLVRDHDHALLNQRLARLRSTELLSEYALLVFQSPLFRRFVRSLNTGSLIQHMFTTQVDRFWMPVPPPETQAAIVRLEAAQREAEAALVEQLYAARTRSTALRRALLAAAFSGRLTGRTSDLDVAEQLVAQEAR